MEKPAQKKDILYSIQFLTRKYRLPILAAGAALLVLLPFIGLSQYLMRITIMIGVYTMLGLGLNMTTGYTGMVSLGQAGFYGIGAYTSALLMMRLGLPFFVSMLAAIAVTGLFGYLISLPTMRLSGPYLTIVTLGFGEIAKSVFINWKAVTNGALGVKPIPSPEMFGLKLTLANNGQYFLMLFLVTLVTLVLYMVINSKFGRAFRAIREDEQVARMMGIRTSRYRSLAFTLSAMVTGLAGAYYASFLSYIDPNSFDYDISVMIVTVVIIGGMGTLSGMFVGAILLIGFPELFRFLMEYRYVVYGLVLIVMMRWRPQGILGFRSRLPFAIPRRASQILEQSEQTYKPAAGES